MVTCYSHAVGAFCGKDGAPMLIDILLANDYVDIINNREKMQEIVAITNEQCKDLSFSSDTIYDEIQEKLNLIDITNISKLEKAFTGTLDKCIKDLMPTLPEGHTIDEIPENEEKISKEMFLALITFSNALRLALMDYESLTIMFGDDPDNTIVNGDPRLFQMCVDRAALILGIKSKISIQYPRSELQEVKASEEPQSTAVIETNSIVTAKITPYPKQKDIVEIPIFGALALNLNGLVSDNGEQVLLDENQLKLIATLKMMVDRNDKEGDGRHIFTLDSIIRYFKGGDSKTDPTDIERQQVANMLDFFYRTPVHSINEMGMNFNFHIVKLDYLDMENVVINGHKTNAYKIYNVTPINHTHNIYYSQFGLPKGYTNSIENTTLWSNIIDKSRDGTNHTIEFELICQKLGVTKSNRKKRADLLNKIRDMIDYYKLPDMLIERSYHGNMIIEKIK